ncbi:argininosuccinate lyase [Venenivibrio stagnispumantis]|uniref:Argininosuccinate lyase n=1 Tax=Venenivibrio stagnispumantis TaxID=407998 RepID=A0AA45WMJ1_9AQUI|nr:argininosuccinate lyase [Venenivibrio stagnispumantis]MCW4572796.1 argininosuccinate lyase [Venenivibrio stagnispumantis]SMP13758.1 argininosuccinate lyase [Venenivibrio stagnispumantis]
MAENKLWGGRFSENTDAFVEEFTESVSFDKELALYDIKGSIAHVKMLSKQGIIPKEEAEKIIEGLNQIAEDIKKGRFQWKRELEDVHMNIEKALIERIGNIGGKVHTGRSRNDQVITAFRLYLKEQIQEIIELLIKLQKSLLKKAEEYIDIVMPAYTHLQRAQPIRASHYFMAYLEMFNRDIERFRDNLKRVNELPLGSGAVAGVDFPIDREFVAKELGFSSIMRNSIDATASRDFAIEFLSCSSICMANMSRLSEDLIIYSSSEFNFVELPDKLTTGSSIMPQKKNPDVLELIRGKTGRVYGDLVSLLTIVKGLPLAYNRDLQEDKEPVFDAVKTLKGSIIGITKIIDGLKIKKENTEKAAGGFALATDLANYLAEKGVPFREAHHIVGKIVAYLISQNRELEDIKLEELKNFSPLFEEDALNLLSAYVVADRRKSFGGTAKERILQQINYWKEKLQA